MLAGELGDLSPERDGSLAGGFFLVDMNDPFACEHRRTGQAIRNRNSRSYW